MPLYRSGHCAQNEVVSTIAMYRQSRLAILSESTDFGLAVRNADPHVGKVLLNEMWERNDRFFFGCTERRDTLNFALSIPNLSLESGDFSWNVHPGEIRVG